MTSLTLQRQPCHHFPYKPFCLSWLLNVVSEKCFCKYILSNTSLPGSSSNHPGHICYFSPVFLVFCFYSNSFSCLLFTVYIFVSCIIQKKLEHLWLMHFSNSRLSHRRLEPKKNNYIFSSNTYVGAEFCRNMSCKCSHSLAILSTLFYNTVNVLGFSFL